jgi:hypothetical protein
MPPRETLATAAASQPNSETLAACVVLAHPRTTFHPCMCGLYGIAATVAAQGGVDRDQLLHLHQRATMLDRHSNSSSAAQCV